MKGYILTLVITFLLVVGLVLFPPSQLAITFGSTSNSEPHPARPIIIPNEYIVFLEPSSVGVNATAGGAGATVNPTAPEPSNQTLEMQEEATIDRAIEAERILNASGQGANVTSIYTRAFNGFAVSGVEDVTPLIINDPAVQSIQSNWLDYPQAQYLDNGLNRIDIDRSTKKPDNREDRPNIDIAVLDEPTNDGGVNAHPDLNIVARVNMIDGCGSKKLPNGEILQCYGPTGGGHGVAVAGLCCAKDNLGGLVGGASGARVTSIAICSINGSCPGDAILRGWDYLVSHASTIEIASMSVGSMGVSTTSEINAGQSVINAGVTFFTAAGNDNQNANNNHFCGVSAFICVSALSDTDGKCGDNGPDGPTYTVGGKAHDDERAPFSNHGSAVDIMAPGVRLLSTYPIEGPGQEPGYTASIPADSAYPNGAPYIGGSFTQGTYTNNFGGTSGATPIAAGIGALVKLANPSFTPAQIKSSLQSNAYSQTQSCDGFGKGGLVAGANSESSEKVLYAGNYAILEPLLRSVMTGVAQFNGIMQWIR